MFIDRVKVYVKTGKGGDRIAAFWREKYVTHGGPGGGDGEAGGDIVSMVDERKTTLLDLCYNHKMAAGPGGNGKTKETHGVNEADCIIKASQGVFVEDGKTGRILAGPTRRGQKEIIAKGGEGSHDNLHFKSSKNTVPQYSELGISREERDIMVELKVLADVGLADFPSAGKSTLLPVASKAKPETAGYHFTTLVPNLGMMQVPDDRSFIMTDSPGLIEGASEGRGLEHQFFRHIKRCRIIIHVVDMGANGGHDPVADCKITNDEPKQYEYRLMGRPWIVLADKMDLDGAQENLKRFRGAYPEVGVSETTTIIAEGLELVFYRAVDLPETIPQLPLYNDDASDEKAESMFYRLRPKQPTFGAHNMENDGWKSSGEELERSFKMSKMDNEEGFIRFARKTRKTGIDEVLRKVNCKGGGIVTICDIQFEFVK